MLRRRARPRRASGEREPGGRTARRRDRRDRHARHQSATIAKDAVTPIRDAGTIVHTLSAASADIGKVVSLIQAIAEQPGTPDGRSPADEAGLFGQRDELGGQQHSPDGMAPPRQGLGSHHRSRSQIEDRLERDEFLVADGLTELGGQCQARGRVLVLVGRVELESHCAALAAYIATSARRIRMSTSVPCSGHMAAPMLADTSRSNPATWKGGRSARSIFSAIPSTEPAFTSEMRIPIRPHPAER